MRCVSCGEPGASAHSCPSCGAGRKPASAADLEAAFSEKPPPLGGPRVGHDFGPRYSIIKTVGAGGMGIVYQALDRELNVSVALKMLRGAPGGVRMAAELQRRFITELVLARQITHKNVIRIHDIGEVNGIRFISMPFIDGEDLGTPLAEGPLPLARTLRYARHLASGLMAVHAAGVVHRDIKPANVMVGDGDQAILMDFGIARSSDAPDMQRGLSGSASSDMRGGPLRPPWIPRRSADPAPRSRPGRNRRWLVRFVLGSAYLQAKQYPEAIAELNMCEVRQGEAAALFQDDEPSIRYVGMLEQLLARAREGAGGQFVTLRAGSIKGNANSDPTRAPAFYDQTYDYLSNLGMAQA